jgi:hypothetical protein
MTHPGGGFKVADAYADFRIDVDDAIGKAAARLKAKGGEFARMGENAGKAFSAGFSRALDLDKAFKSELAKLRAKNNQIEREGNRAGEGYGRGFRSGVNLRSAMTEQVAVVRSARAAFSREGKQAGDAYARGFGGTRLAGPSVSGGGRGAESAGEEMAHATARGFTKGGRDVDSATQRVAQRAENRFAVLKFAGLSAGLPAAAGAGVLATTAILGGAVGAFAGLGIAMAIQADRPRAAWLKTANDITSATQSMVGVFEGPLAAAAQDTEKTFDRIMPAISHGFQAASRYVIPFTDSVLTAAEEAIPALSKAAQEAGPAMDGLGNFVERVGSGAADMLIKIASQSTNAGLGLRTLGAMTRDLLGFTGDLVANLTSNQQELGVLNGALNVTEQAVVSLTARGSGAVGFLHGFGQAASGALGILGSLSSLIGLLPAQVTQFGGAFTASSMILKKFGVDAGAGFDGFGKKVKEAEGFTNKFKTAGIGLIQGALNPAALATFGLGILLDQLGQKQQEAAEKAQEHKEAVRQLTDALRQDGGAIGDVTRQTISKALADKNASGNAQALGARMSDVQAAALGNANAMHTITLQSDNLIKGYVQTGALSKDLGDNLLQENSRLLANGGAFRDKAAAMLDTAGSTDEAIIRSNQLSASQQAQLESTLNLSGAIGSQIVQAREAQQAYEASEMGLNNLSSAELRMRDAAIDAYNATQQQVNASLGLRGAILNTQQATDEYNKVMKDHTATTRDKEKATLDLERAQQAEIQAAYQQGLANSKGATDTQRNADAMKAANQEAVKLAMAFAGPLPASLQTTIGKMDVTSAQAAGLKVKIDAVGNAVYVLPNGKEVKLTGDNKQALDAIRAVQEELQRIHDKTAYVTIVTRGKSSAGISPTGPAVYSAQGNMLTPRGGEGASQPVEFYASGGIRNLRAMSGSQATMVAPDTWRVVGDNMKHTELFAPLDGSRRTAGFIMQAAQHEGLLAAADDALRVIAGGAVTPSTYLSGGAQIPDVSMLQAYLTRATAALPGMVTSAVARAVASTPALTQPHQVLNVYPPPEMDYNVIAAKVSRLLALRGR